MSIYLMFIISQFVMFIYVTCDKKAHSKDRIKILSELDDLQKCNEFISERLDKLDFNAAKIKNMFSNID